MTQRGSLCGLASTFHPKPHTFPRITLQNAVYYAIEAANVPYRLP
jgi:hypothetical protein